MNNWEDFAAVGAIFLVAVMLIAICVLGGQLLYTKSKCLKAGYPSTTIDVFLNFYCIKRQDQTDVVVPAKELK